MSVCLYVCMYVYLSVSLAVYFPRSVFGYLCMSLQVCKCLCNIREDLQNAPGSLTDVANVKRLQNEVFHARRFHAVLNIYKILQYGMCEGGGGTIPPSFYFRFAPCTTVL